MNDTLDIPATPLPFERETNSICKWILTHPHWSKAFPDFKPSDVVVSVVRHLQSQTIRVMQDNEGIILGIMMFTPDEEMKEIKLEHLLGRSSMIVPAALQAWCREYPEWNVNMIRKRKPRTYMFKHFFREVEEGK